MKKRDRSFCGRSVTTEELEVIREVVQSCRGIGRTELANTVFELLEWKRPSGKLKGREGRQFMERRASGGLVELPPWQGGDPGEEAPVPAWRVLGS